MSLQRLERWMFDGVYLSRAGRSSYRAIPDNFVLETTIPTALNSGAGVIRTAPTVTLTGDQTVPNNSFIVDKIIEGNVTLQGNAYLENCIVRGRSDGSTGSQRAIVNTDLCTIPSGGWHIGSDALVAGDPTKANLRFVTIDPQTPSAWQGGIGNKNFYAYRCKIERTTDCFAVFATVASGGVSTTRVEGCYANNMVQWAPDVANGNRTNTHNDIAQFQGNSGGLTDSIWLGNAFYARHDATFSALTSPRTDFNGITLSPITGDSTWPGQCWVYMRGGWMYGGGQTFNGGTTSNASGGVEVKNMLFERPGTDAQAPTRALVIHSNMSVRNVTNCTYIDNGATVPVGTS